MVTLSYFRALLMSALLLVVAHGAWAAPATCNQQTGSSIIGVEASAVGGRYSDGSFDYNYAFLQCVGGTVGIWTDTVGINGDTPYALYQASFSSGMTFFSNSCGSHAIFVNKTYTGTLNGAPSHSGTINGMLYLALPSYSCTGPSINPDNGCAASGPPTDPNPPCPQPPDNSNQDAPATQAPPADGSATTTDPIQLGTGNSYEMEVDWAPNGVSPLRIIRYYNSQGNTGVFAPNWRTEYDRSLVFTPQQVLPGGDYVCAWDNNPGSFSGLYSGSVNIPPSTLGTCPPPAQVQPQQQAAGILAYRHNGKSVNFPPAGGADLNGMNMSLTLSGSNWILTDGQNNVETYTSTGQLSSIRFRNGLSVLLAYDSNNRLHTVSDNFGHQLTYSFNAGGQLQQITDPGNNAYLYGYDGLGNLNKVIYPDTTIRQYQYTNSSFPNSMTSLIDENNQTYAAWGFDGQGRAQSNQLGNAGINARTIGYVSPTQITDTNALGAVRTLTMKPVLGHVRVSNISVTCPTCSTAISYALGYDTNGNVNSRTDFLNNQTTYIFDLTRNLETSRTEGLGSTVARTIGTVWDPVFRLPDSITDGNRKIEYKYDSFANLTLQRVTDTATGNKREVDYTNTYNNDPNNPYLQKIVATGPRTDVVQKTVYVYYPPGSGNNTGQLYTVTDPLNHTTTYAGYDASGRVGTITDANGVVTTYTYYSRGWLKSATTTVGATTYDSVSYSYYPTGQLQQVLFNTGYQLNYSYDPAHRLTDIVDGAGNRIHYVLDLVGNVTERDVTDSTGVLSMRVEQTNLAMNLKHSDPYDMSAVVQNPAAASN